MGYFLDEAARELVALARDFAENEVKAQCRKYDISGQFPADIMKKAIELKLHLIELPAEYGGLELDLVTCAAIYEEIARADAGIASTLATSAMALRPVLLEGTKAQLEKLAGILFKGGYGAFALTEPMAGSDASNTLTTAVRDGEYYVINGNKCFISNGGIADFYIVFAMTDKSARTRGLSAFIVEKSMDGVLPGCDENKMGLRLSNTAPVFFRDVRVPAQNLIGKEGKGFSLAMKTLDTERALTAAISLGIARRALDESVAYAKERETFGKPIIENQGIQFMLADMDMETEMARQMTIYALRRCREGLSSTREAAMAKCCASDIAMQVSTDALQIMGGYGYSRDYPVEKLMRDAKAFQILEGTNQILRMVIAGGLMKNGSGASSPKVSCPRDTCKKREVLMLDGGARSAARELARILIGAKPESTDIGAELESAEIVIGGGLGVGREQYSLLNRLACELGGVIACTRPPADFGWLSQTRMIGQTGKTINPKLYIACGISGAVQHCSAISGTETIVAINRDPSAPIFRYADYGIVGSVEELIPVLITEIKQLKKTQLSE